MSAVELADFSDADMQRVEWRARFLRQIIDLLRPDADQELAYALVTSALDQAKKEGMVEAASLCRSIGERATEHHQKLIGILANNIERLAAMNANGAVI